MVCSRVCGCGSLVWLEAHACGGNSWMCLVPTCVAMVIGGDLYSRVCQWLLDVVVAHLYVGVSSISWIPKCLTASWMFLLP